MTENSIEIEAFEPVTLGPGPAVTLYQDVTYHSSRAYEDTNGSVWRFGGTQDGASLWRRDHDNSNAMWNITAVVDQFGPLAPIDHGHPGVARP